MKISIAMATYNGGKYLQEQLDSFVAQSRRPDEVVITDDGSTDDTLDIIERFARSAPFEVVWSKNEQNLGYARNFNAALMKTTGDLVFLSDQDDAWFPKKIEAIANIAESDTNNLVFINDAMLTDSDLNETGLTKIGQIYAAGFEDRHFVMGCCSAVKRGFLGLCLPIPEDYSTHDDWIVGIAGGLGRKRIIKDTLQYYRRHGGNESQLVSNRTTPINRWSVRISDFRKHWSSGRGKSGNAEAEKKRALIAKKRILDWAHSTAEMAPESIAKDISKYRDFVEREYSGLKHRQIIQNLRLPSRIKASLKFWRSGGYEQFSGLDSAIRDILFS